MCFVNPNKNNKQLLIRPISLHLGCNMKRKNYDFIICGGGASGLMLALQMQQDPFFKNKSVLIIDKNSKETNDRTWCFWEKEPNPFENLIHRKWERAVFKSPNQTQNLELAPYSYKMIRAIDFYQYAIPRLKTCDQVEWLETQVIGFESETQHTHVHTQKGTFSAARVFSSWYHPEWVSNQKKYPVLQQHFVGWVVETENNCFNPDQITFMDFDVPQNASTRFMYVLPFAPNKALLEDTFFSEKTLSKEAYEKAIKAYLKKINAGTYSCLEQEQGSIPMTAYPFHQHNTTSLLHIGTAGGWTKASTGYTFQNTLQQTQRLVTFLKENKPLHRFHKTSKFAFYDLLFLDVLQKYNAKGGTLFEMMFQKNPVQRIFRFLDNQTTFAEDLMIMRSFPVGWFLNALWKRMS